MKQGPEIESGEQAVDSSHPFGDSGVRPDCVVEVGSPADGWVEVPLLEHPGLDEPGAWVAVSLPEALLYVIRYSGYA